MLLTGNAPRILTGNTLCQEAMATTINRTAEAGSAPPRERILNAARELFYRHGIRAVGVETIAEAAATNKMTLYRHFGSKDELIAAYLTQLAKEGDEVWEALARDHPGDPNAQLEGWVRYVEQVLTDGGERGRGRCSRRP